MTNTAITVSAEPIFSTLLSDQKFSDLVKKVESANPSELTRKALRGVAAWLRYRKAHDEVYDRACMNWSSHRRDLRAACRFVGESYFRKTDIVKRGEDGLLHYEDDGLKRLEEVGEKILTAAVREIGEVQTA
jgi:hypothetical protein